MASKSKDQVWWEKRMMEFFPHLDLRWIVSATIEYQEGNIRKISVRYRETWTGEIKLVEKLLWSKRNGESYETV